MFERSLFGQYRPAYYDLALGAGFRFVPGDLAANPDVATLESIHGSIDSCAVGSFRGRTVAVFDCVFYPGPNAHVYTTIAFDIGEADFCETPGLLDSWSMRHDGRWVYFELPSNGGQIRDFMQTVTDAGNILELYLR